MLNTQFLASCSRPSHPSHEVIQQPQGARKMKNTLKAKHGDQIEKFLTNGAINPTDYKKILDDIHTEAVRKSIAKLEPNPLLNAPPPPISPSEATLTRKQRTTLAQLRSGQCQLLNDYKVLTGRSQSALCPECLFRRHTAPHIFDCDAAPTDLTIRDLWINPKTVVNHLVSLQSFTCLLPTGPHPPRPPPEPPPPPP